MDSQLEIDFWYTMYKFTTIPRKLEQFQSRCTQYESDPNMALSFIPKAVMKQNNGKSIKFINGTRFTTIRFEQGTNYRTNLVNLDDEKLNEILAKEFGIVLKFPIPFNEIMNK